MGKAASKMNADSNAKNNNNNLFKFNFVQSGATDKRLRTITNHSMEKQPFHIPGRNQLSNTDLIFCARQTMDN